jgi:signal transduction histidine kinase
VLPWRRLASWFDDPRAVVRVPLRLGLSVVTAAAVLWLVGAIVPVVGFPVLFPAFVGIVCVSAVAAGTLYGVVTMALFGAGYAIFYSGPTKALGLQDRHVIGLLVAYAFTGFVVASVGGAVRKAYARARDEHRAAVTIHEQREDLLKALTHDVRSRLNVITMNAALLTRAASDPAVVSRRAQAIEKSAVRLAGMLGELVDTVRLESGHVPLERSPVNLASFVRELKSHLEGTLPLDRVQLAIPEGLPALYVDPRRFERILVNLLSNALKYAPPPTPVMLGASAQGRNVVVTIADRGPGISQQDLPHIFDKYYRASGSRKKEGLGIGLYSTRLLVQLHGGRVWVESELGKGTTFYVALPTASSGAPVAASASSGAADAARGGAVVPEEAD